MAAELIMPTLPGNQQQSRHFLHNRPVQHTRSHSYQVAPAPLNTTLPAHHASTPPSPTRSGSMTPGARPLYMPAVLRPNYEFPPQPLSKSPSANSDSGSDTTLRRTNTGLLSLTGLGAIGNRLSRRSTMESRKSVEGEWNLDMYPEVSNQPTRKHWKPDTESTICDDATCFRTFNYFTRRHHCRKCGNIFCDSHSNATLPLDEEANFNPRAAPSRTCNHCFEQFKSWQSRRNSESTPSSTAASTVTPASAVPKNMRSPAMPANPHMDNFNLPAAKDVAASVPRDWNWSTF